MLENGYTILDCRIVKPLSENDVYQSYLVSCSDSTFAKLLLISSDPPYEKKHVQLFLEHADWVAIQTFPNIGTPIKAGEHDGQLACLYPVPPGTPLAQVVNDGFTVRQSVEIIHRISLCLGAPHSAGMVHGNLSPESIFLDADSVYLADFSLGLLVDLDYHSGIDPHYTSPEQVRGEKAGSAADIYSLGCIFYHLLTGRPPFSGADAFTIAMQHLQGQFPPLPGELADCQNLLDSLLSLTTADRLKADEVVKQTELLLADPNIDHLHSPVVVNSSQGDPSAIVDELPFSSKAEDTSAIAARVEARLKEHSITAKESVTEKNLVGGGSDVTDGLAHGYRKDKTKVGRFVLVFLTGVLIGSIIYLSFFDRSNQMGQPAEKDQLSTLSADLDRGLIMWESSDIKVAENWFKGLIKGFPDDPRAYNNLAAIYASQGHYDQARDTLEQAMATNAYYVTVYNNLGSVYAEMARDSYGKALQLNETQPSLVLPLFSGQGVVGLNPVLPETAQETKVPSAPDIVSVPLEVSLTENPVTGTELKLQSPLAGAVKPAESIMPTVEQPVVMAEKEEVSVEAVMAPPLAGDMEIVSKDKDTDSYELTEMREIGKTFLQKWARAWSEQDADAYLGFYAENFIPPGGKTRADWESQRRRRLSGPKNILIELDDFKLKQLTENLVQVEVIQSYKSDIYADRSRKVFDL